MKTAMDDKIGGQVWQYVSGRLDIVATSCQLVSPRQRSSQAGSLWLRWRAGLRRWRPPRHVQTNPRPKIVWLAMFGVGLVLLSPGNGLMAQVGDGFDDLATEAEAGKGADGFLSEVEGDVNKQDRALIKNSFFGTLRYWNGVDRDNVTGQRKPAGAKDGQVAESWGWRFDTRKEKLERIPGKDIPVSALLNVPESGSYRIWLRRVADKVHPHPVELKISGANKLAHVFGQFALTGSNSLDQEGTLPLCFEDEAIRATAPSAACQVWEYWEVDLKKGDSLFELSTAQEEAQFSHIFISASKSFTPRLPKQQYTTMLLRVEYEDSTLLRVFYRFRVRDADVDTYGFRSAGLKYHWHFDPKKNTYDGIWGVGLGQESPESRARHVPRSLSGKSHISCGEWTDWLDATWASQGSGPWATGVLEFTRLKKGKCDIELAWSPHPSAVVKTITVEVEDGIAKFCAPLSSRGKARVVLPDRQNRVGVWGVVGKAYLDWFKSLEAFNQQYAAWIKEAKEKLGITRELRTPPGLNFITKIAGDRAEQRMLAKTLVSMGINRIAGLPPDICAEVGIEPLLTGSPGHHTSDPADPARPVVVRQRLEALLRKEQEECPDVAQLPRLINVGDEIGPIAGTHKINQSVECLKLFRKYLAEVLREKQQTPAFFGVASLDDLECLGALPRSPGLFERRLCYHSTKFKELLTGHYYRPITEAARPLFPQALTYANYSPAPLRQGSQVHSLTWFTLLRQGSLSLAWGEDWVYPVGAFTGYEIVSYYAAFVECAARKLKCPSGFYNVVGGAVIKSDSNIVSSLSRDIKFVYLYHFGPSFNATAASEWEGCWSDIAKVYPDMIKAIHVADFIGRPLAEGKIEERKVALLYNRDHEIMNGGSHGEQSDRALTFAALGNCHYNADLILNEDLTPEILKQYSALFINGFCLPRASVPVLKGWVENGGLLIASAGCATRDEYNSPLPEMEEVFGARQCHPSISEGYIEPLTLYRHRPIGTITVSETEFSPALAAKVIGMRTSLLPTTAQPIASFDDGTCAAALNRVGRGQVLLWGIQPGILYKGQRAGATHYSHELSRYVDERLAIFEKPLRKVLGPSPLSTDAPQVELTRLEAGDQTGILVNNFRRYAWKADLPPMRVAVRLRRDQRITGVSSAMHGELQWKTDGEWLTFTSPVPSSIDSFLLK